MAALFAWGSAPGSFMVANGTLLQWKKMPAEYEGEFKMNRWNALTVYKFFAGGNNYYFKKTTMNDYNFNGPKVMIEHLENKFETGQRGAVKFLSFHPDGNSWFIRYDRGNTCYLTDQPKTFTDMVTELQELPRAADLIDMCVYGHDDVLLVRFENGNSAIYTPEDPVKLNRVSQQLVNICNQRIADGWTFGDRTTLCPWDSRNYFIEWVKGTSAVFTYETNDQEMTNTISSILNGEGNDTEYVKKVLAQQEADARQFKRDMEIQGINLMNQQAAITRSMFGVGYRYY
ncbi:hypothetical protein K402DRAFT_402804 [Aulographum hederae CBS 113979]|uniref:Uncharacterized protein n=1 Tax=Aulographum hederae CBS 113979 TaxID=1176131 RepID=A0A6G1H6K3_9PEZI|nr:hypothetical protein K402DRAFT_402804 [Aulographum hederae CBS 113979]